MKPNGIQIQGIYPEGRHTQYPSQEKIRGFFHGISTMELRTNSSAKEMYHDPFTPMHKQVLQLMGINESEFCCGG